MPRHGSLPRRRKRNSFALTTRWGGAPQRYSALKAVSESISAARKNFVVVEISSTRQVTMILRQASFHAPVMDEKSPLPSPATRLPRLTKN